MNKKELIQAATKDSWKDEHILTDDEIANLPAQVPLRWVCTIFNKEPASQVNVARLCNDMGSVAVASLVEVQSGDLIAMGKNSKSKHVAIVISVEDNSIEIWNSYREDASYGGIMSHQIRIIDKDAPIEEQSWLGFDLRRYENFAIRRPKAFII